MRKRYSTAEEACSESRYGKAISVDSIKVRDKYAGNVCIVKVLYERGNYKAVHVNAITLPFHGVELHSKEIDSVKSWRAM